MITDEDVEKIKEGSLLFIEEGHAANISSLEKKIKVTEVKKKIAQYRYLLFLAKIMPKSEETILLLKKIRYDIASSNAELMLLEGF